MFLTFCCRTPKTRRKYISSFDRVLASNYYSYSYDVIFILFYIVILYVIYDKISRKKYNKIVFWRRSGFGAKMCMFSFYCSWYVLPMMKQNIPFSAKPDCILFRPKKRKVQLYKITVRKCTFFKYTIDLVRMSFHYWLFPLLTLYCFDGKGKQ